MERMIVTSLAISSDKISRCPGPSTTDEIIKLIHKTDLNLETFTDIVNTSEDFKDISDPRIYSYNLH